MAEPKKPGEVAVASPRSNVLTGSLTELLAAFDQISSSMASLSLNGWNAVNKCKAACWLAHAAGVNPATFMQNHYCMEIQGKLLVEPKWEYIVGTLQSRVPGFKFEIVEEENDRATVRMSDGKNEHTVTYTLEDARRQGLLNRGGNMWTSGNTREGCLKQAIKRCGRRLSSAALMDLPMGADYIEVEDGSPPPPPASEEVKGAIDKLVAETSGAPKDTPFEDMPPEPPPPDPITALGERLTQMFGKQSKAVRLEKASFLYNQMMLAKTGVDPKQVFKRVDEIGPHEAQSILDFLDERDGKSEGSEEEESVPEPEGASEPEAPPPLTDQELRSKAYSSLMETIYRARKLFGRAFIQDHPTGSGKFWFTDLATFSQTGDEGPVKIMVAGQVVASTDKLEALNRVLSEACDKKERGGR